MLLSETDATKKWCPMTRYILDANNNLISNRQGQVNDPWDSCLGSGCMLWEWRSYKAEIVGKISRAVVNVNDGGYCRLGGQP